MKDITKKVVILNNFSSPYICEAIIVLRDYNQKLEGKIIEEAEKIVAEYIEKNTPVRNKGIISRTATKERSAKPTVKRMKKKPHFTVPVLLILIALAAVGAFLWITG